MKIVITLTALATLLFASNTSEMSKMQAEYEAYASSQKKEFGSYKEAMQKEYDSYKKELSKYWEDPKLSTKKTWVSYSKDKKSRSDVDFKKKTLTVEVIAKDKKEAMKKLQDQITYAISKNTKEVVKTDVLQKKIASLKHDSSVADAKVDAKPILTTVYFKRPPTKKEVKKVTQKLIKKAKIETKKSKAGNAHVYKLQVKLPKNATVKRSQTYASEIDKNAKRFKMPEELVFAIMHTESCFNPFAKSHIPAFGLMQIVPRSAGRDMYRFLHKRDGMPSASYLYNSKNNIEMGTSYLYTLYYKYLKSIKNPTSRLYCTIAAYNTGAGNIAYAFTRHYNVRKAAPLINKLTPEEVYNRLLKDLRFDEPKHYLKRVRKRMALYKEAYNL